MAENGVNWRRQKSATVGTQKSKQKSSGTVVKALRFQHFVSYREVYTGA